VGGFGHDIKNSELLHFVLGFCCLLSQHENGICRG
jgi:hypothetical protein